MPGLEGKALQFLISAGVLCASTALPKKASLWNRSLCFCQGAWGRAALEGKGPQRRPQKRLDRRLEEVAKAVGGGYCRLQMPLKLALVVRQTVAGHRLGALVGGGGVTPPPSSASLAWGFLVLVLVPLLPRLMPVVLVLVRAPMGAVPSGVRTESKVWRSSAHTIVGNRHALPHRVWCLTKCYVLRFRVAQDHHRSQSHTACFSECGHLLCPVRPLAAHAAASPVVAPALRAYFSHGPSLPLLFEVKCVQSSGSWGWRCCTGYTSTEGPVYTVTSLTFIQRPPPVPHPHSPAAPSWSGHCGYSLNKGIQRTSVQQVGSACKAL